MKGSIKRKRVAESVSKPRGPGAWEQSRNTSEASEIKRDRDTDKDGVKSPGTTK